MPAKKTKTKKIKKRAKKPKKPKIKVVLTKGKKKRAVARVRIKEGNGSIKINKIAFDVYEPEFAKKIIIEPLVVAEGVLGRGFGENLDIRVNVKGGGVIGQAQACRTALGKALLRWTNSMELKKAYLEYDRSLLIDDVRRKEPKKFMRKGARARPTKSYR